MLNDLDAGLIDALTYLPPNTTCLFIMAGTTVGASVAINGKPFSGVSGFAGELGYFPINEDGESTRLDKIAGGAVHHFKTMREPRRNYIESITWGPKVYFSCE